MSQVWSIHDRRWYNTTAQYSLWFIVGFIFNYYIRKRAFDWWKRYNCKSLVLQSEFISDPGLDLLQASMDTGTALATIIIFFALGYHSIQFNWWGNTVGSDTYDSNSVPWLKVSPGGHFGKGPGEFWERCKAICKYMAPTFSIISLHQQFHLES